jgi:regulator of RNase E activity RraA
MPKGGWEKEIIDYIKRNRVSTTEVADCLNKSGEIPGVKPINLGHFRVGSIHWVYAHDETNWDVHDQIRSVKEGDIVLVECFECGNRAIFGDLVSKYLILYKQAAGIVVMGNMRDAPRLIKENWPIWCYGLSPVGCFNKKSEKRLDKKIMEERSAIYHDAIAVCDDCGVVAIPKEHHTRNFYRRLERIEKQEDIWYECIDRRKWSTFETVCLKKYLRSRKNWGA